MRLALALLFAIVALPAAAQDVAIVGVSVVDVRSAELRPDQTVVVQDGRIARVAPATQVDVPEKIEVLPGEGRFLIPGLIDAHVHLFQSGGLFTRPDVIDLTDVRPYPEEINRIRRSLEESFARYIASGVTGIIDMGGPMWTFDARETAEDMARAPRVAVAGPLLGTMAPREFDVVEDRPILHIETPEEARRTVADILTRDPDLLKVWMVSAGRLEADMAWVAAVVEQGEAAGVPVVAHATRREIADAVVEAGVDLLAHSVEDQPMGEDLLSAMAERDVVYITTLVVDEGYREVLGGRVELSPIEQRLGDPEVIASWRRLPTPRALPGPAVSEAEAENLRQVAARGVTVAAGSDAGNIGTLHGPALHRELELMVEAGLTPHQVLAAATLGGAKAMGRADDLGSVEEGKLADLVLLDANPLEDIRNTRAIHRVLKGGHVFDPADCC